MPIFDESTYQRRRDKMADLAKEKAAEEAKQAAAAAETKQGVNQEFSKPANGGAKTAATAQSKAPPKPDEKPSENADGFPDQAKQAKAEAPPPPKQEPATPAQPQPQTQEQPRGKVFTQPMELKRIFEEFNSRVIASLPKHINNERWISVILAINNGDHYLQKCSPRSIFGCALQAATLGLDFNKTMQEAYLIPRKTYDEKGRFRGYDCTFMPGYRGLRKLVLNNPDIVNVRSDIVYQSEADCQHGRFAYRFTPDLEFLHEPCLDHKLRGPVSHAYAIAKMKSGEYVIEVMTIDAVEETAHHRAEQYKAAQRYDKEEKGPWVTDYLMMVRKTPLKRLCGQLPMSADVARVLEIDNSHYISSVSDQLRPPLPKRGTDSLLQRLGDSRPESNSETEPVTVGAQDEEEDDSDNAQTDRDPT